ncbi:putative sensory transduction protein [Nocardioides sp. OK12]|uniref:response regulator transcription factor n=1 Tax=Nocardioides sp. OK12 TaxID=2758661 RepID=UPI0021C2FDE9|nr:response regulator transcription factor [Nocardioides sp. OK12]GHJ60357.1 putative sensory transduction protein [Nocardioides sp. OK12]
MSEHRALVVDDDPDVRDLVVMVLEGLGLETRAVGTGRDAVSTAREWAPDLVTLDLTLPDADGTEVCRELRTFTDAYVVMITGRDTEVERLVGLEVGADEYLVKPFSPRELKARAAALLRRPRVGSLAASPSPSAPLRLEGGLVVSREQQFATLDGVPLPLTPPELDLLATLATRPGQPWAREALAAEVWSGELIESDFVVDVQVAGLRRKLRNAAGRDLISTVGGSSYQLDPAR